VQIVLLLLVVPPTLILALLFMRGLRPHVLEAIRSLRSLLRHLQLMRQRGDSSTDGDAHDGELPEKADAAGEERDGERMKEEYAAASPRRYTLADGDEVEDESDAVVRRAWMTAASMHAHRRMTMPSGAEARVLSESALPSSSSPASLGPPSPSQRIDASLSLSSPSSVRASSQSVVGTGKYAGRWTAKGPRTRDPLCTVDEIELQLQPNPAVAQLPTVEPTTSERRTDVATAAQSEEDGASQQVHSLTAASVNSSLPTARRSSSALPSFVARRRVSSMLPSPAGAAAAVNQPTRVVDVVRSAQEPQEAEPAANAEWVDFGATNLE
jgi:hypothetical protein